MMYVCYCWTAEQYKLRHFYLHKLGVVDVDPSALRRLRNMKCIPRCHIMPTIWTSICGVYRYRFNTFYILRATRLLSKISVTAPPLTLSLVQSLCLHKAENGNIAFHRIRQRRCR
jgi:hypothetical protein